VLSPQACWFTEKMTVRMRPPTSLASPVIAGRGRREPLRVIDQREPFGIIQEQHRVRRASHGAHVPRCLTPSSWLRR
jgi:hypothetical protein